MAFPNCPRSDCNNGFFQLSEFKPTPQGSSFRMMAIHCSSCGAVVGTTEIYNVGWMLSKICEKLGIRL